MTQVVQAKLILLDPKARKIGLSMKSLESWSDDTTTATPAKKRTKKVTSDTSTEAEKTA